MFFRTLPVIESGFEKARHKPAVCGRFVGTSCSLLVHHVSSLTVRTLPVCTQMSSDGYSSTPVTVKHLDKDREGSVDKIFKGIVGEVRTSCGDNCSLLPSDQIFDLTLEQLDTLGDEYARDGDRRLPQAMALISTRYLVNCSNSQSTNDGVDFDGQRNICLKLFEDEQFQECLDIARHCRDHWSSHQTVGFYDSLVQLLIRHQVKRLVVFPILSPIPTTASIPLRIWVTAHCPARLDLQGGWTDTPPVCYELGGKVINIGIKINGQKPIGARARRVAFRDSTGGLITVKESAHQSSSLIAINTLDEIKDFENPFSPGVLVKAALVLTGIVDLAKDDLNLEQQLERTINGGLEIETFSNLPQGSGLGTSSILASAIIAILWRVTCRSFTKSDLIQATIYLEQAITTGGGWQDQVGGVSGGLNLGHSSLLNDQLLVQVTAVRTSPQFMDAFISQTVLIYTGTVRLAKNILQNVVRSWYSRDEATYRCFEQLLTNAELCSKAFEDENIDQIGQLLTSYWHQKKVLAPSCEPQEVATFLRRSSDLIHGGTMAGAGGGGFMFVVLKQPAFRQHVVELARKCFSTPIIYELELDVNGIEVVVGGALDTIV